MPTYSTTAFTHKQIVARNHHLLDGIKVTIETPENLAAGSVLGRITGNGKYILSLSGAADGSEVPRAILAEPVDASAADAEGMAYFRGDFIEDELTIGTAHTADSIRDGLRSLGILMVKRTDT